MEGSKAGCCHASDVPLLFGMPTTVDKVPIPKDDPVGDKMRKIWARFAYSTDPGWPEYRTSGVTYKIDND